MQQKIVFLDIDGTMVCFDGSIPESAQKAVKQARANGHKMVVCSGRSRFQVSDELLSLGFDGIVCGAGARVVADGKDIYHAVISEDQKKKSFDYLESNGFLFCYQGEHGLIVNKRSMEGILKKYENTGMTEKQAAQLQGQLTVCEDVWKQPDLEKIIFYDSPFPVKEVHEQLLPYFDTVPLSLEGADGYAGEIGINGIHKATGMQIYLDYVGASREDTIAIGDGPNDLQMMDFARTSVAMGNALQAVKDRADLITTNIDDDGIYHAFEKLGLL